MSDTLRATPLAGRRALVTGASSGIGRAIALELGAAGAAVAVNWLRQEEEAAAVVAAIEAAGGRAVAVGGDVSREPDVVAMVGRTVDAFGGLDLLVANAGIERNRPFDELTLDDWQRVLDVNLTGAFLCAREAVRELKRRGRVAGARAVGGIVFVSSVHEVIPWGGHVNYAASKGGLGMMMRSLAQEVAPLGIRVNSVAPGAIRTPINRPAWETPEAQARLLQLIPYGRIGEPEDVARAVAWLASDAADYVTGATLFVDGGMTQYPAFARGG